MKQFKEELKIMGMDLKETKDRYEVVLNDEVLYFIKNLGSRYEVGMYSHSTATIEEVFKSTMIIAENLNAPNWLDQSNMYHYKPTNYL